MNLTTRPFALFTALALAATGSIGAAPTAHAAQVAVGVAISAAPPPPRYARVPPPRRGFLWAPGYWRWDYRAHRHVWVGGYWVRARPGHRYVPERWVHHSRGWYLERGHWIR